jgi:D-3-phosphoglycerate dehydrogenase
MEDVNAVNAAMLAKERGIEVCEVSRESSDHFNNLIRLEVEGDDGSGCVSGTMFDGIRPRLVSVDSCEVEIAPAGRMLLLENKDRPGVVAAIGAILAEANINIGDFRLGRNPDRETAISIVSVDSRPGVAELEKLSALPNMLNVRYVELADL